MKYRKLGRTGWEVSEISFGCWAIGGDVWGKVEENEAMEALRKAVELGVNFFDTADVYGDGKSERLVGRLKKEFPHIKVATKAGRRLYPHIAEGYNRENLERFIDRSLKNLGVEVIDLLQLHCPPFEVYYTPEVFDILDEFVKKGKILYYGVSVEKVEGAIKAIEYPNVQTVQIIFNMFRHRPSELFFELAKGKKVGILARVPLASGLLTGKFTKDTKFDPRDHRSFNRDGKAFDRGETFSGVDYDIGLRAMKELKKICPQGFTMTQFALKWILMYDAVTCAIPGAKRAEQIEENVRASDLPYLTSDVMQKVKEIYEKYIKEQVHQRW